MDIFELAKIIVAVTSIGTFLLGLYQFARKFEGKFDNIENRFDEIEKKLDENTVTTLRLALVSDLPDEERLKCGKRYVDEYGGNGACKRIVNDLEEEEYKKMVANHNKESQLC